MTRMGQKTQQSSFVTRQCNCTQSHIGSGYNQSTWLGAATSPAVFTKLGLFRLPFIFNDGIRIVWAALFDSYAEVENWVSLCQKRNTSIGMVFTTCQNGGQNVQKSIFNSIFHFHKNTIISYRYTWYIDIHNQLTELSRFSHVRLYVVVVVAAEFCRVDSPWSEKNPGPFRLRRPDCYGNGPSVRLYIRLLAPNFFRYRTYVLHTFFSHQEA